MIEMNATFILNATSLSLLKTFLLIVYLILVINFIHLYAADYIILTQIMETRKVRYIFNLYLISQILILQKVKKLILIETLA